MLAIGLMSGTSADGVDAALMETDGESTIRFLDSTYVPYHAKLRGQLLHLATHDDPLPNVLRVERALTECHAVACQQLLASSNVTGRTEERVKVIGFHGHTIRHLAAEGLTWQIGDASYLAHQMQIPVVSDFRRRDMAAGGHGAPLAALFHQELVRHMPKPCAILNLGGVANVTWLGREDQVIAGDTGPGCGLLDSYCQQTAGQPFDRGGRIALQGTVHQSLVEEALALPFFSFPLPRSADRFDFGSIDVSELTQADGAATLCAITAQAVYRCFRQLPEMPRDVWISGGGVHHPLLMQLLSRLLPKAQSIEQLGLRPDSLEAECFAWLAVRRLRSLSTSDSSTTGAKMATCGGLVSS